MSDRDCPRNHDEPLYRRITDGFLEIPVDYCPACGEWVCTDGTPAPLEPPVLSREFLDSLIDKRLPLIGPLNPNRYFIEPTRKTMREGAKILTDAILESLSQEDASE